MKNLPVILLGICAFVSGLETTARAQSTLWYNGDFNGKGGLRDSFTPSSNINAWVYDDFTVTSASGGWHITAVFGNIQISDADAPTLGNWSIRSGVSNGDGGTLVASGVNAPLTLTPTGRTPNGNTEYKVMIAGLDVNLAAGTYWLGVQPVANQSYISSTSGAGAVGIPSDDGNAYFDSPTQGNSYALQPAPPNLYSDYSMGIVGTAANGSAVAPILSSTTGTNHQFGFMVSGTVGSKYVVQATANLLPAVWTSLATNTAPFFFTETNLNSASQRFYRGLVAP